MHFSCYNHIAVTAGNLLPSMIYKAFCDKLLQKRKRKFHAQKMLCREHRISSSLGNEREMLVTKCCDKESLLCHVIRKKN